MTLTSPTELPLRKNIADHCSASPLPPPTPGASNEQVPGRIMSTSGREDQSHMWANCLGGSHFWYGHTHMHTISNGWQQSAHPTGQLWGLLRAGASTVQ